MRIWDLLLFPVNWDAPGGIWLGCAILASCAALLAAVGNRGMRLRSAAVLLASTALAVLPAVHLAVIGQSALGSRILYLPPVGFVVWAGHGVASLPSFRRRAAAALLLFGSVAMLEHNLGAWHGAALAADRVCSSTAAGIAPSPEDQAKLPDILSFGNGLAECVSLKRGK